MRHQRPRVEVARSIWLGPALLVVLLFAFAALTAGCEAFPLQLADLEPAAGAVVGGAVEGAQHGWLVGVLWALRELLGLGGRVAKRATEKRQQKRRAELAELVAELAPPVAEAPKKRGKRNG